MSLYVGNLSSRSSQDDLLCVFQKFGRCNVRLKDGYGFVVYEYPPNAEKALRALQQKKYICGEPLTLTWSNKQPRSFARLARPARYHKPHQGRYSVKGGDYAKGKLGSGDHNYRRRVKQSDVFSRRHGSTDRLDKEATYPETNLEEELHGCRKDVLSEVHRNEPDPVNNDRWGKQFSDQVNEMVVDDTVEFDRYERFQGYDRKFDDPMDQMAHANGSLDLQSPPKDHSDEMKFKRLIDGELQVTCYRCGGSGHKKRNCPQENASRRKSSRFDSRHHDDIKRRGGHESEKFRSRSVERLQSSGDAIPKEKLDDVKFSGLGRNQRPRHSGSSPVGKETDMSKKKQYDRKKRSRKEIGYPKGHSSKKARSVLPPSNSDCTVSASPSASKSSEPPKGSLSHSISRSVSSRAGSLSSESRSSSIAPYSRSGASKSRVRSSSRTSLSLSVGHPLQLSSNKAHFNPNRSPNDATTPESIEQGELVEVDKLLGGAKVENGMVVANNENPAPASKMVSEIVEKDKPVDNDHEDHKVASGPSDEVANPNSPAGDKGAVDSGSFCPKRRVERNCQNPDELKAEHMPVPLNSMGSAGPVNLCSNQSTVLSSEELCMVLKHYYGLELQNEEDRPLPIESYFGSARLWPWEVIYYRRLKKGPISIKNYERRIRQNREFNIDDKYIRRSSGWEELGQLNL